MAEVLDVSVVRAGIERQTLTDTRLFHVAELAVVSQTFHGQEMILCEGQEI
jgi:hypothetical protein